MAKTSSGPPVEASGVSVKVFGRYLGPDLVWQARSITLHAGDIVELVVGEDGEPVFGYPPGPKVWWEPVEELGPDEQPVEREPHRVWAVQELEALSSEEGTPNA